MKLDSIDIKILATLQREGRITKVALAEQVHLSPTPCWERLKKMERLGLIQGYHATIALKKIASHALFFTEITLSSHTQKDFQRFENAMTDFPEIMECWATGGGVDYMLKIIARDIEFYQAFVDRLLDAGLGIDRYFTYVVTKPVKDSREIPLEHLLGPL